MEPFQPECGVCRTWMAALVLVTTATLGWSTTRGETDDPAQAADTPAGGSASRYLVRVRRAGAYISSGQYDSAVAEANEAIKRRDRPVQAYHCRGLAWVGKKEFRRALADFDRALRIDPHFAMGYADRGAVWLVTGLEAERWGDDRNYRLSTRRALRDLNRATELDPRLPSPYVHRGYLHYNDREYNQAIADYTEAIRIAPTHVTAYVNRHAALAADREYQRAMSDMMEAHRLDPRNPFVLGTRAWFWATCPDARFRDGARAVRDARLACELTEWKDGDYLEPLAAAYAESGDFSAACEYQTKALELLPHDNQYEESRGRLLDYRAGKPCHKFPVSPVRQTRSRQS